MTENSEHTHFPIAFIDTEIEPKSGKVLDIGSIRNNGASFHKASMAEFIQFLDGVDFVCGHNVFNHDLKYIGKALNVAGVHSENIINTLYFSTLLFPTKPYHCRRWML
ncbi:hypothetical protein ASG31_12140 [Chryseobacterium sp. Leaf404]|uniref:hypothetical protein n=1 Tax=unclassified Chryseobacterium TaxID=2593645 RepID=UPI0006F833B6|nr:MULTISPECIES: hypothetical protein [unclassified Chryseobacterium]KQT17093.1 hypothetical protein ASG31_12140 [Chryseobacterium sp. Leaf404]